MNDQPSFIEKDFGSAAFKVDLAKNIKFAKETKGKSITRQVLEILKLSRSPGKISLYDYYYYRLYDDELYTLEEKQRFLATMKFWTITPVCCPKSWWAVSEDKWITECILARNGIPTTRSVAVICAGPRSFGEIESIKSAGQLDSFLSRQELPVFAKPLGQMASIGAIVIEAYDDKVVRLAGGTEISLDGFFKETGKQPGYIVQKLVAPHGSMKNFSKYLGTVRLINFVFDDRITTAHALLKVIANDNIADNYWRRGNMLANLDISTGRVTRVVTGSGCDLQELTHHPDSGEEMIGFELPRWREVLDLNSACAALFAELRFNSLDVAITEDGPIVIEVNVGSAFNLPQLASGQGFLTEEAYEFFRSCGVKI